MDKMMKRDLDDSMRMLGLNPDPEAPRDPRASESTSTSKAYKPSHGGYPTRPRKPEYDSVLHRETFP